MRSSTRRPEWVFFVAMAQARRQDSRRVHRAACGRTAGLGGRQRGDIRCRARTRSGEASRRFYAALNLMLQGDPGEMPGILVAVGDGDDDASDRRPRGRLGGGREAPGRPSPASAAAARWRWPNSCSRFGGRYGLRDRHRGAGRPPWPARAWSFDHRVTYVYRREADGWKSSTTMSISRRR